MDIKALKSSCALLGIDYTQFINTEEVEKGVAEGVDYKKLYLEQKAINEKILGNIGEISKSFTNQLDGFKTDISKNMENQIKELEKSFGTLRKEVDTMKQSPMRNAKSARNVTVIEKAVNGGQNGVKTLNLKVPSDVRELKNFLSTKAIEELGKGVQNGVYERASLQLDASHTITPDLAKKIFEQDKILIQ